MVGNVEDNIVLTERELEVLKHISEGFTVKEIASKLYIAETTVIFHRNNLRKKFKARNTAELISKAFKYKIP